MEKELMGREKINLFKEKTKDKSVVVKNDSFMSVFLNLPVGEGVPNHSHEKMAQLVVLEGKVRIHFEDGQEFELSKGELLSFNSKVTHNVVALEESKALVTVGLSFIIRNPRLINLGFLIIYNHLTYKYYYIFSVPQLHNAEIIGARERPLFEIRYSTLGGI